MPEQQEPTTPSVLARVARRLSDRPWEIFAMLGTLVFTLGWAGIFYLVFAAPDDSVTGLQVSSDTASRVYFMVNTGATVVIASGILWGIAALTWRRQSQER